MCSKFLVCDFRPKSIVAKRLHGSRCHLVRRRPTRHCVRCGPSYPRNRAHPPSPNFGPCLRCQMAGWMKTPLVKEVDLGPGDIVLDGVPAPVKAAQQPPLFGPCLLWPWSPSQLLLSSCYVFLRFSLLGLFERFNIYVRHHTRRDMETRDRSKTRLYKYRD